MTVVPLLKSPTKKEAQAIIRKLVADGMVKFHAHCNLRKKQRQISTVTILNVLETGSVIETPYQDLGHKGWNTAVLGSAAGKMIKVAVVLEWSQKLLVITCYEI